MGTEKVQGVLVRVNDIGVLVRGPSGSGKSLAALNLMRRGHCLVADDLVEIVHGDGAHLIGRGVEQKVRIEVRGLGIYRAVELFPSGTAPQARIDLVVDLDAYDPKRDAGRTSPDTSVIRLMDKELTAVRLPVASGMDVALMIELVARLYERGGKVEPS
jgi:HPr kinase/phosphorylase